MTGWIWERLAGIWRRPGVASLLSMGRSGRLGRVRLPVLVGWMGQRVLVELVVRVGWVGQVESE